MVYDVNATQPVNPHSSRPVLPPPPPFIGAVSKAKPKSKEASPSSSRSPNVSATDDSGRSELVKKLKSMSREDFEKLPLEKREQLKRLNLDRYVGGGG